MDEPWRVSATVKISFIYAKLQYHKNQTGMTDLCMQSIYFRHLLFTIYLTSLGRAAILFHGERMFERTIKLMNAPDKPANRYPWRSLFMSEVICSNGYFIHEHMFLGHVS